MEASVPSDQTEKAKTFLAGLLPEPSLESLHPVRGTEAPALERVPIEHRGAVESAAAKLATGESLNPPERFALEAIIIPDKRPAIDIVGGDYNVVHPLWTHLNQPAIKARLRPPSPRSAASSCRGIRTCPMRALVSSSAGGW